MKISRYMVVYMSEGLNEVYVCMYVCMYVHMYMYVCMYALIRNRYVRATRIFTVPLVLYDYTRQRL